MRGLKSLHASCGRARFLLAGAFSNFAGSNGLEALVTPELRVTQACEDELSDIREVLTSALGERAVKLGSDNDAEASNGATQEAVKRSDEALAPIMRRALTDAAHMESTSHIWHSGVWCDLAARELAAPLIQMSKLPDEFVYEMWHRTVELHQASLYKRVGELCGEKRIITAGDYQRAHDEWLGEVGPLSKCEHPAWWKFEGRDHLAYATMVPPDPQFKARCIGQGQALEGIQVLFKNLPVEYMDKSEDFPLNYDDPNGDLPVNYEYLLYKVFRLRAQYAVSHALREGMFGKPKRAAGELAFKEFMLTKLDPQFLVAVHDLCKKTLRKCTPEYGVTELRGDGVGSIRAALDKALRERPPEHIAEASNDPTHQAFQHMKNGEKIAINGFFCAKTHEFRTIEDQENRKALISSRDDKILFLDSTKTEETVAPIMRAGLTNAAFMRDTLDTWRSFIWSDLAARELAAPLIQKSKLPEEFVFQLWDQTVELHKAFLYERADEHLRKKKRQISNNDYERADEHLRKKKRQISNNDYQYVHSRWLLTRPTSSERPAWWKYAGQDHLADVFPEFPDFEFKAQCIGQEAQALKGIEVLFENIPETCEGLLYKVFRLRYQYALSRAFDEGRVHEPLASELAFKEFMLTKLDHQFIRAVHDLCKKTLGQVPSTLKKADEIKTMVKEPMSLTS